MVRLVVFSGVDGSGKSTHAKILYRYALMKRIRARYVWLRFFSFITYPLFLYARLTRKTVVLRSGEARFRVHLFWFDPALRSLYPRLILLDVLIRFLLELIYARIKRVDLLIADRFLMDTMVDLIYEVRNCSFFKSTITKASMSLVGKYRRNHIVLLVGPSTAIKRKSDIVSLKEISCKYALYKVLAGSIGIKLWDTTNIPIQSTSRVIFEYFHEIINP